MSVSRSSAKIAEWDKRAVGCARTVPRQEAAIDVMRLCVSLVSKKNFPAVVKILCGVEDPSDENCAGKHTEKTLQCGHKGCNFQKEDDGCRTCNITDEANVEKDAIAEDISTIKSVMGRVKSKSIQSALESMIKDHEGSKRKRLDEKEDEDDEADYY
eukprot:CAMPEP_0170762596 /NCGR_PEP_ID=MMETSP0733-20121128/2856_1 /TAXON_ID=186038 /ORGANISM="Fragilariopsis kerguelensis, Strain L26-C5" /LENGTH=156 /DNA_ID=CAMNT_0011102791 /DNA_START=112 /DNA_END=584 /DNA_ORIENTATION=+